MSRVADVFPPVTLLLDLEVAEVAGFVLEIIHTLPENDINLNNFLVRDDVREYAGHQLHAVKQCIAEGWAWLESEVMIAARHSTYSGGGDRFYFITRRGATLRSRLDLDAYRRREILPKLSLSPTIQHLVKPMFDRGQYEPAVLQAFIEVEAQVRKAAALADTDLGTSLMRTAFHKDTGALRDPAVIDAERESMAHFAAGAIGLFKNPRSHRRVPLSDPAEAAEMILIANYLLRIVSRRQQDQAAQRRRDSPLT